MRCMELTDNTDILNQMLSEPRTYYSYDKIICDDGNEIITIQ